MRNRLVLLVFLIVSGTAAAIDGVYEINQVCVPVGCFPGDPPGFPVFITESGSYRLTSNLVVPDANTTAIGYDSGTSVRIDFNGFGLEGPVVCDGTGSCSATGTGIGIMNLGSSAEADSLEVSNGFIKGFGGNGIFPVSTVSVHIQNVTVSHSGVHGIDCSLARCTIKDSKSVSNGSVGILAAEIVTNSQILNNGGSGVSARRIEGCVVSGNGGTGIEAKLAIGNDSSFNGSFGFVVSGTGGGYTNNYFQENNGGTPNPQVGPGAINLGGNVCGVALCP